MQQELVKRDATRERRRTERLAHPNEVGIGRRGADTPAVAEVERPEILDEARRLAAVGILQHLVARRVSPEERHAAYSAVTLSAAVWLRKRGSRVPASAWLAAKPPYAWMTVSYAPLCA